MEQERVVVFEDEQGQWRWHRLARNNEVIATSGEGYVDKVHAVDMAVRLNKDAELIVR